MIGPSSAVKVRTCPFHWPKPNAGSGPARSQAGLGSILLLAGGISFVLWQLYVTGRAHGGVAWAVLAVASVMLGGGLIGLESVLRRARRTSESFRQGKETLRAILNTALDAIVTMDAAGRITAWNPQAEVMFGWTRAEALGRAMSETVIPARYRDAHNQGVKHFLATGEGPVLNRRIEISAARRDGSEFPIELAITPLKSGSGFSFTAFIRDISARQKAEAELGHVSRELLEASRRAGMAEVATGVLHNVGNVLTSVNVSATVVMDQMRDSKAANLPKIGAMLQEHAADLADFLTNDPKGRRIPGYLIAVAGEIDAERTTVMGELQQLRKSIDHIKDIVGTQQNIARSPGVVDTVDAGELVEDSLRINASALVRYGLDVVRAYQPGVSVVVDRSKVIQILVNLIWNAKFACVESGRPDKQLTVRITRDDHCVRIAVSDNGVGIPAENLTRIFAHGFTTRKEGHGFGLHSGALAAKELGGSLTAQSDGLGHGAVFVLELPGEPPASPTRHSSALEVPFGHVPHAS